MLCKENVVEVASRTTKSAAQRGVAAVDQARERLTPLAQEAARRARPYAEQAWEKAKQTKVVAADKAAGTMERLQPGINAALDRVSPAVDRAQHRLQEDVLPRLVDLLHEAGSSPVGQSAAQIVSGLDSRADASLAAFKAEVSVPTKTNPLKKFAKVAVVGTIIGGIVVAVKTFLASRDNDWAAYEPKDAYVYPDDTVKTPATAGEPEAESAAEVHAEAEPEAHESSVPDAEHPYGDGSYRGDTPPAGFAIKGNGRSMKYHTPESPAYDVTTPEVWFASEEAAQAAGFSRAQY